MQTFERVNLYLPKSLVEELKKEADIDRRSLNNYIKLILEKRKPSLS
jgi:hypothetical protein